MTSSEVLQMFFVLIPTSKVARHGEVVARFEERVTARFGGCSRVRGLTVIGLWIPKTGSLPFLDENAVWMIGVRTREDIEALKSLLSALASDIGEQAVLMTNGTGAASIVASAFEENSIAA